MMDFVRKLRHPLHCEHCEGISDVENPKHHPGYEITQRCNLDCILLFEVCQG